VQPFPGLSERILCRPDENWAKGAERKGARGEAGDGVGMRREVGHGLQALEAAGAHARHVVQAHALLPQVSTPSVTSPPPLPEATLDWRVGGSGECRVRRVGGCGECRVRRVDGWPKCGACVRFALRAQCQEGEFRQWPLILWCIVG
jgi:hypothetical protein